MKIELTIYREHPSGAPAATREMTEPKDSAEFLTEAVERVTAGIHPGEKREVGVGIKVVG